MPVPTTDFPQLNYSDPPTARQFAGRIRARKSSGLLACAALALALGTCQASRLLTTIDPYTAVRTGPSEDHNRITVLHEKVPVWAETKRGSWYQIRLHPTLTGWINEEQVAAAEGPGSRPQATVRDILVEPHPRGVRVTVRLDQAVPYRVRQVTGTRQLKLDLFGTRLARYGVRCKPIENFIGCVVPEQIMDDWAELTVDFGAWQQTGYEVRYGTPTELHLDIRRPYANGGLAGKVVALDPGHGGGDRGALGPTGLQEKDVNLGISLKLRQMLLARGAAVVMSRDGDRSLAPASASLREELTARVLATKGQWPDIFVSVHNNHLGSGDATRASGTETYYWTPMSYLPARVIHNALCRSLGTESRFVSWRPFLVLRETDTPRVLVECAYISHPDEEALLRRESFQTRAAEGILQGLVEYFLLVVPSA